MEEKDFNKVLDKYLTTGKMLSEEYEALDDEQRLMIQRLKRAFARLNKKEILTIHHSLK